MTPIQTGLFLKTSYDRGEGELLELPLYNFKTANNTATKITQNNVVDKMMRFDAGKIQVPSIFPLKAKNTNK